eukprot:5732259-Pyramimonas_sp.AAC.1
MRGVVSCPQPRPPLDSPLGRLRETGSGSLPLLLPPCSDVSLRVAGPSGTVRGELLTIGRPVPGWGLRPCPAARVPCAVGGYPPHCRKT